jgi:hypothetical protein
VAGITWIVPSNSTLAMYDSSATLAIRELAARRLQHRHQNHQWRRCHV